MSNAGTWLVDASRPSATRLACSKGSGRRPVAPTSRALDGAIGGLQKRQFLLVSAGPAPVLFQTRWAMSYLRGPLTKDQIAVLTKDVPRPAASPTVEAATVAVATAPPVAETPASDDQASPVSPPVAPGISVAYLDPAAPWAAQVGRGGRVAPARLLRRRRSAFASTTRRPGVDEQGEYEAVYGPLDGGLDLSPSTWSTTTIATFGRTSPGSGQYVLPAAPVAEASFFRDVERDITRRLVDRRTLDVFRNRELKLTSRPGETQEQFLARCDEAAQREADAEAAAIKAKLEAKQVQARGGARDRTASRVGADTPDAGASGRTS